MSTQSATDFLTFTIAGRPVKVDPDIYYQIFNVRPTQRSKYAEGIIGLRFSGNGNSYPAILLGSSPPRLVSLARFITNPPAGMVVDHINGDTFDNRRENLRIATYRQNALNVKARNNSGFAGVCICTKQSGNTYCKAQFNDSNGKRYCFYVPDCPEHRILAAYAHDKFVLQSGDEEYAPLNFESFKYEPFRSFLLETDLNEFKIR
ncbi:MAG: HNH endonuclease signature motif containing protein [Sedimentisphaerales bacterium]|jgi:hypothetical protein